MRWIIFYLAVCLIAGAVLIDVVWTDPGYVLIRWNGWQLESSMWLAFSFLISLTLLFWLLAHLLTAIFGFPFQVSRLFGIKRGRNAKKRQEQSFVAFLEGRWFAAEKAFRGSAKTDRTIPLSQIFTAISAHRHGKKKQAIELLNRLEKSGSAGRHLMCLTRAQLFLEAGEYARASDALDCLDEASSRMPASLKLRGEISFCQKNWLTLIGMLPDLKKQKALPDKQLVEWESIAWISLMKDDSVAIEQRLSEWQNAPTSLQSENSPLINNLILALQGAELWNPLETILKRRLELFCEDFVLKALYSLPKGYGGEIVKVLKKWLKDDKDGRCHRVLAQLMTGLDMQGHDLARLWAIAHGRQPSPTTALGWSSALHAVGDKQRAKAMEKEAMQLLISAVL